MITVVTKNDKIFTYEREESTMSDENSSNLNVSILTTIKNIGKALAIVLPIATVLASAIAYVVINITAHKKDIETLNDNVAEIKNQYNEIDHKLDELISSAKDDHSSIIALESKVNETSAYNIVFKDGYNVKMQGEGEERYLAAPIWKDGNIIASDVNGDIIYKAEDLYNTPILTSYMEGDNEVYFYGKYNENNHWNGCCILNVYLGDKLLYIFEGIYDDGELFSYKRVSSEKIISEDNIEKEIWIINKRVVQDGYNSGETWSYEKSDDFIKGFTLDNVKEKQILAVDKFIDFKCEKLLSYYKGNTSNGTYNDKTGNAYLVTYKENGDVKRLYKGNFENGDSEDQTGNAWTLSWGNANDGYHYHNGEFKNGKPINTKNDWKYPVDQEFINSIVNPEYFNCSLAGLIK